MGPRSKCGRILARDLGAGTTAWVKKRQGAELRGGGRHA
jgi:hypothetical protein